MGDVLAVLLTSFSLQTIFGLFGGFLGGTYAMLLDQKYVKTVKCILVILSGFAGGALADYLYDVRGISSVMGLGLVGAVAGVPVGFGMEAIRLFAPKWFDKLLAKLGNKYINKIGE